MKESRSIEIDFIIETTGKSEHGKTETKIHCGARQTAPEKPGTGPDACGAGDLVFGPHPHGAGFCAGQRGLEDSARRAVWCVWLRQLGLVFASSTVIVFSDIPADVPAATMVAACYQNGVNAWLSGGALGAVLGGNLLLLCGRPAANLVMAALALCASLYIFDITPAEVWQWLCNVGGGVHEKGVAVYEQNAARRAERRAERLAAEAEEGSYEEEDPDELDEDFEDASRLPAGCPVCSPGAIR